MAPSEEDNDELLSSSSSVFIISVEVVPITAMVEVTEQVPAAGGALIADDGSDDLSSGKTPSSPSTEMG